MEKENKTPKEILRDEKIENIIDDFTQNGLGCKYFECSGDDMEALLNYIKELEESHAYVYDAYQDLGKEKFKLEEKIDNKIKELEEKKVNENDLREFVKIGNQIEVLKEIRGE